MKEDRELIKRLEEENITMRNALVDIAIKVYGKPELRGIDIICNEMLEVVTPREK